MSGMPKLNMSAVDDDKERKALRKQEKKRQKKLDQLNKPSMKERGRTLVRQASASLKRGLTPRGTRQLEPSDSQDYAAAGEEFTADNTGALGPRPSIAASSDSGTQFSSAAAALDTMPSYTAMATSLPPADGESRGLQARRSLSVSSTSSATSSHFSHEPESETSLAAEAEREENRESNAKETAAPAEESTAPPDDRNVLAGSTSQTMVPVSLQQDTTKETRSQEQRPAAGMESSMSETLQESETKQSTAQRPSQGLSQMERSLERSLEAEAAHADAAPAPTGQKSLGSQPLPTPSMLLTDTAPTPTPQKSLGSQPMPTPSMLLTETLPDTTESQQASKQLPSASSIPPASNNQGKIPSSKVQQDKGDARTRSSLPQASSLDTRRTPASDAKTTSTTKYTAQSGPTSKPKSRLNTSMSLAEEIATEDNNLARSAADRKIQGEPRGATRAPARPVPTSTVAAQAENGGLLESDSDSDTTLSSEPSEGGTPEQAAARAKAMQDDDPNKWKKLIAAFAVFAIGAAASERVVKACRNRNDRSVVEAVPAPAPTKRSWGFR